MRRRCLVSVVLTVAALALPAAAQANVYCVPASCTSGTPHATVAAAITAADAHAGADVVDIGPGTYSTGAGAFVGNADTTVRGAGPGQTILTSDPANGGGSIVVIYGYMGKLSDLTLRLASSQASGNATAQAFDIYNGIIENVDVDAEGAVYTPGANNGSGTIGLIRGGSIDDLKVSIPVGKEVNGLSVGANSGVPVDLRDIEMTAPHGIASSPEASPTPVTNTGKRLVIHSPDPFDVNDGFFKLSDSVLDASMAPPSTDPYALGQAADVADGRPPNPAGLTMDRVTLVGNGQATSTAFILAGQGSPQATFLEARHIVTSGFPRTIGYAQSGSTGPTATITNSVIQTGPGAFFNAYTTPAALGGDQTSTNVSADPQLGADFVPARTSPAVDIGGDDLLPGDATDLAGNPRPVDGNGDGTVAPDAGAYERQYTPDGATLTIEGKKIKLTKKGAGKLALTCPPEAEQPGPCTAAVTLTTAKKVKVKGKKKKQRLARTKPVDIAAGSSAKVGIKLSRSNLRLVQKQGKARKVVASVAVTDGNGESATVTKKLKLEPKKR